MPFDRLAGTLRRAPGAVLAAALAAAVVALPGCSDGPSTPGALFDEGCRVMLADRPGAFWDLMTRDQQDRVRKQIEGMKRIVERNPGARKPVTQYGFAESDWEAFVACPIPELWARAHKGQGKVLAGVRILDAATDPQTGQDVFVTFETVHGQQFRWVMRHEKGRGWRFHDQAIVGTPTGK